MSARQRASSTDGKGLGGLRHQGVIFKANERMGPKSVGAKKKCGPHVPSKKQDGCSSSLTKEDGPCDDPSLQQGENEMKSWQHLYLAIDEACSHVKTKSFRCGARVLPVLLLYPLPLQVFCCSYPASLITWN